MTDPHVVEIMSHEGQHFPLCLSCGDRGRLEAERSEAADWATAHRERSIQGNMTPLGNRQITTKTAARLYRERSEDPRWTEQDQALWGAMADELEERINVNDDEGQQTLF